MGVLEIVVAALDIAEIDKAMAESPEVLRAVMEKANEARDYWRDYWNGIDHPHAREHKLRSGYIERPGDYADSIRIKYSRTEEGLPKATVTAHDYKAHWIEYGSTHMPEFAPRAATVSHFGGANRSISS